MAQVPNNLPQNSINSQAYQHVDWDTADANGWIDKRAVKLYANSGNMFTVNWTQDNTTFVSDPKGASVRTINHNGQADITFTMSRFDTVFKQILNSARSGFNVAMHSIVLQNDAETVWTSEATLARRPQMATSGSVPTATVTFHCAYCDAMPNNLASEKSTNNFNDENR